MQKEFEYIVDTHNRVSINNTVTPLLIEDGKFLICFMFLYESSCLAVPYRLMNEKRKARAAARADMVLKFWEAGNLSTYTTVHELRKDISSNTLFSDTMFF